MKVQREDGKMDCQQFDASQNDFFQRFPISDFVSPVNMFCVTVYNEEIHSLARTLFSIVVAMRNFHVSGQSESAFSTICIIADGVNCLVPGLIQAMTEWGFLAHPIGSDSEGTVTYTSQHDLCEIQTKLSGGSISFHCLRDIKVNVVVCIKKYNFGKLHSHKLFFSRLCPMLNPRYCYQIDTGSLLDMRLISIVVQRMESEPMIGAIAPLITTATPKVFDSFLINWQYFDFAFRTAISWPFEVVTGHLSVIPGQASVLRWSALNGNNEFENCAHPDSPVHTYIAGMVAKSATDRIRYLAEDRVIGASLMLSKDIHWKLDYVPQAIGVTDYCESFYELLRQRRRWNNSSMIARYWLLEQLPLFMRRTDRDWKTKLSFVVAMVGQSIVACREFFAPAILIALLISLAAYSESNLFRIFFLATCLSVSLNVLSLLTTSVGRDHNLLSIIRGTVDLSAPLLFLVVLFTIPFPASIILLAPTIMLVPFAIVLPQGMFTILRCQLSAISGLAMFCVVSAYAFCRIHDVSWGTKGLRTAQVDSSLRNELSHFRNKVLAWWVIGNASIVSVAVVSQGAFLPGINVVTALVCAVDAILAFIALGFLMANSIRTRKL